MENNELVEHLLRYRRIIRTEITENENKIKEAFELVDICNKNLNHLFVHLDLYDKAIEKHGFKIEKYGNKNKGN